MTEQISIYRFNRSNTQKVSLVAVTEDGGAIYLTPVEARKIALALIDAAKDAEMNPSAQDSEFPSTTIELSKG